MVDYVMILGFVAGAFTTFSFLPQTFKSIKTKSTKDISWYMLIILISGLVLWMVYGIIIGSSPLAVWNFISLLTTAPMAVLKLKYG
ncbi:MAG: SemiSWEET transporter [Candidatus Micrarchaeota archaeon]|nr:SemiSWEET transporter [Candidatus Micrarchaeota archaeon]